MGMSMEQSSMNLLQVMVFHALLPKGIINEGILVISTLETFPYTHACVDIMAVAHTLQIIKTPLQRQVK